MVDALRELFRRMGEITDDGERSKLASAHEQLTLKYDELVALRFRNILDSDATEAALAKLNAITSEIVAEAKRMKTAPH